MNNEEIQKISQDAKIILNKFIAEAYNEIGDFTEVTPQSLKMPESTFYTALKELEKAGYIKNIQWGIDGGCLYDDIEIETTKFKLYNK